MERILAIHKQKLDFNDSINSFFRLGMFKKQGALLING